MQSKARTVKEYLDSIPEDRRTAVSSVRDVILKNLDKKYAEGMTYGMIGYFVPHSIFPAGYHCDPRQPLPFAALASQKNYMSLYLMGVYCGCDGIEDETCTPDAKWFQEAWKKTGKKLDMGKCCIRFKKLEDVALDVVGEAIRRIPADTYIKMYEASLAKVKARKVKGPPKATAKAMSKKAEPKKVAKKIVVKKAAKKAVKKK